LVVGALAGVYREGVTAGPGRALLLDLMRAPGARGESVMRCGRAGAVCVMGGWVETGSAGYQRGVAVA